MSEMKVEDKRRAELLSDARVLINWLEANPDIPVDRIGISYHVPGDDERGVAELARIAKVMCVPVMTDGGHHTATTTVGFTSYRAVYIERQDMADWSRRQEIAQKLVDEEKALKNSPEGPAE